MADSGHGVSITFQSGYFSEILSVTPTGWSRAALPTSHSGTSAAKTFIAADLADYGELQVEVYLKTQTTAPPFTAAAETVTVTFPVPSGGSVAATYAGSAFMTGWSASIVAAPDEQIMTASFTMKKSGAWTFTAGS